MTKLFVGGVPYSFSNQQLEEVFAQYGTVISAQIVTDRTTGQSKGFAFVEMEDDAAAQASIQALDGTEVSGRKIGVSVARPKEDPPDRGGFGGGNNGGFRGGSNDRRGGFGGGNNRGGFRR